MTEKLPKGISKCRRPKMTNVRGRTWDQCELVLPDGTETKAYLDTTWGTYFYFQTGEDWHCGKIDAFKVDDDRTLKIDLRQAARVHDSQESAVRT
jgi:hypothetical protein